jgi:TolB-like protein
MGPRFARASTALALGFALFASALGAQEDQQDRRPGVAVLRFDNGGSHGPQAEEGDFAALEVGLQQMLLTELAQSTDLRIVERGRLNDLLAEQDLSAEGRTAPGNAVQIGKLVGARYVVLGSFTDLFGQFRMDARVVDTETGDILESESVRDRREKIYDLLVDLAGKIIHDIDLPALPERTIEEHKSRDIPPEAITLFSRAQLYEDGGQKDRAIELYRRLTTEFPDMVQARQALEQITGETGA